MERGRARPHRRPNGADAQPQGENPDQSKSVDDPKVTVMERGRPARTGARMAPTRNRKARIPTNPICGNR